MNCMRRMAALSCLLLSSEGARSDSLLDHIRNYDLNDYALGVTISGTQNLYLGGKDSAIFYPFLTSFRPSDLTDDWLLIRDGGLGARWVTENDWELGAIGRIQTLGFGDFDSDDLRGVSARKWTLEAGPTIGWRGWPMHINLTTYFEPTNRHDGSVSELSLRLPKEWPRGYFIPSIDIIYQDANYADYYYSVTAAEATLTRPAYRASAATNVAVKLRWGYALSDKWLLNGTLGLEKLDSDIMASPIVDRDQVFSASVGVAYNANVFQPREYDGAAPRTPNFEFRISGFLDTVDTKVTKDTVDGVPGVEIDVEDFLGISDSEPVLQIDATLRIAHYHRFEFGYFELGRLSTATLENDLEFGDELFPAGTELNISADAKVFRVGYAYSLIRNAQLELAVMAGLHVISLDTDIATAPTDQRSRSMAGTPLPVIGAHASIFLTERTTLGAKLQFFRTDFDRYEGSLNYAMLEIQHQLGEKVAVGVAFNYYGLNLSSRDSDVNGHLKVRHYGPMVFFSVGY